MEIKSIREQYNQHPPKEFFDWWFSETKGGVMELRFLSDKYGKSFKNWKLIVELSKYVKCFGRKLSLFITSFDQYKKIITSKYRGEPIAKYFNIFFSINPKKKHPIPRKDGTLYKGYSGKYGGVRGIKFVGFDIEFEGRDGDASEADLKNCITGAKFMMYFLKLEDYFLNVSGSGTHLILSLDEEITLPTLPYDIRENKWGYKDTYFEEIPEFTKIKKAYWHFIEYMDKKLKEKFPELKVDPGCKDFTRILRPPATMNVKQGRTPRFVGTIEKMYGNNEGMRAILLKHKPKITSSHRKKVETFYSGDHRYSAATLRSAPIVQLLTSRKLPEGGRNHYLELQLALLMKQNNIRERDIPDIISDINNTQHKNVNVRPEYLDEYATFNPETVNTWCANNHIMPVYEIMYGSPFLPNKRQISEERFDEWDDITFGAMNVNEKTFEIEYKYIKEYIEKKRKDGYEKQKLYLLLRDSIESRKGNWEFWKHIIRVMLNKIE